MGLQRGHISAAKVEITDIRSLERSDLSLLLEKRPKVQIQSLRDSHHRVARAVASGLSNIDVAAICGISANRVSVLKDDPAFSDLVAHYRGIVTADWVASADSFMEVATANMLKAEVMLSDKLDDAIAEGKPLPTRDLLAISRDAADRFGYGKMQKNLNVNVDFAAQLEAARRRSSQARVVEAVPMSPQMVPQASPPAPLEAPSQFRRRV